MSRGRRAPPRRGCWPSAPSYAAALRQVAGRRRVRVQGRWGGGERGAVHAGAARTLADEDPVWSVLATDP